MGMRPGDEPPGRAPGALDPAARAARRSGNILRMLRGAAAAELRLLEFFFTCILQKQHARIARRVVAPPLACGALGTYHAVYNARFGVLGWPSRDLVWPHGATLVSAT